MARPQIEPLSGPQELSARLAITRALIAAQVDDLSWTAAEQAVVRLLDQLRGEGLELVSVRWRP